MSSRSISREFSRVIERMLHPLAKTPTQEELDLRDYVRLVLSLAKRFVRTHVEYEDLVMVGIVGLLEARQKFDPLRSGNFRAYAHMRILGQIYSYCQSNTRTISIPTHIAKASSYIEKLVRAIEATGELLDQDEVEKILLRFNCSIEQRLSASAQRNIRYLKERIANIAKNSGLGYEQLAELARDSLVSTVPDSVLGVLPSNTQSVEELAADREFQEKLKRSLGDRKFRVLELHSLGFTNPEIAQILYEESQEGQEKVYKKPISRSAVKALLDNALDEVRRMRWCNRDGLEELDD